MLDLNLQNYADWTVWSVTPVKKGFGFRVVLKYEDGSEKIQQKSGFKTKRDANTARDKVIGELSAGNYVVYSNVSVSDYMDFWLEEDIKKRVDSNNTYYSFSEIVKNHIKPAIGNKILTALNSGDIQKLYNTTTKKSVSVARLLKSVMNISLRYAVSKKFIAANPAKGVNLPKSVKKKKYHIRNINTQKTLTMEQVDILLEASKDTPIHMMVLFNVLMGLRCSEIIGLKYSDIDYVNRTITVQRQLGKKINTNKEDVAPKTLTKQEVKTKTISSVRVLPIPDYVFEAILKEKELYEKHKSRRKTAFQDLGYICCSAYGRPRSKNYHWKHYKHLLAANGLPDTRWHDLRSTYCTMLLKNQHNPKAVSKLMGHAKEIITLDVYADNKGIIADGVPEIEAFMDEVLPRRADKEKAAEELLEIEIDVSEFIAS